MKVAYYDALTGEIKRARTFNPEHSIPNDMTEGYPYIVFEPTDIGLMHCSNYYVSLSPLQVTLKATLPIVVPTFVEDVANTITGLPVGTVVTWPDGVVTTETDGTVEVTFDMPGDYTFYFACLHYLPLRVIVHVST